MVIFNDILTIRWTHFWGTGTITSSVTNLSTVVLGFITFKPVWFTVNGRNWNS